MSIISKVFHATFSFFELENWGKWTVTFFYVLSCLKKYKKLIMTILKHLLYLCCHHYSYLLIDTFKKIKY